MTLQLSTKRKEPRSSLPKGRAGAVVGVQKRRTVLGQRIAGTLLSSPPTSLKEKEAQVCP